MLCLTAQWVLPIDLPPVEYGEVAVEGNRITYCGAIREAALRPTGCTLRNFGEAVILPGLVNTHSHIEYTMLRGFLEDIGFFPWLRTLMTAKSRYERDDWLVSARLGALECIASGITTIGDNTDAGVSAQVASELGLRARIYQEIFGIDDREPVQPLIDTLDRRLQHLASYASDRVKIGVSPHALYSVRPELFRALSGYCEANGNLRTSIHVAESNAETDLAERGEGHFAEMLQRRGITWNTPGVSPTRYLYDLGALTSNTLCVHCVHQSSDDLNLIAAAGASIAHCPKSNAKLGAGIAPLSAWLEQEKPVTVGLGTDSAVSNNTLDLFEEMRFGLLTQRAVAEEVLLSADEMVRMATLGGAAALGLGGQTGSLTPGKQADIIAVRLDGLHASPATDPYASLVYSARGSDVCLTMVDGRILYEDGRFTGIDAEEVRRQAVKLRARIAGDSLGLA